MASEDSVEDVLLFGPPLLATRIHRIRNTDKPSEPLSTAVVPLFEHIHHGGKGFVVRYTRRKGHVATEERNHGVPQDAAMPDLEDQDRWVSRLGKDRSSSKYLRSHLEETSSIPVLINVKLRLNEVAEGRRPMALDAHTDAALTFNDTG
jgi:hypothetical protein